MIRTQNRTIHRMRRLLALIGIAMALAVALPDSTEAVSFREVTKLIALDALADDRFGHSVAISGDIAVVAAPGEDAAGFEAGAVYVLQRFEGITGSWREVRKLIASDGQAEDHLGVSVAVGGDTVIVGSPFEDSEGIDAGAAYIFQRDAGGADNWGEVKKLTASDAQVANQFGLSVAISGDTAIVGSNVVGNYDDVRRLAGAAYVFERHEGGADNWGEVKRLLSSDRDVSDHFGWSVALSSDTAVVSALFEDAGGDAAGAAYVFVRTEGGVDNWGEVEKLTASDAQADDQFGISVAISGETVIVGATFFLRFGGSKVGAAYIFQRDAGGADNWGEVKKLTASDAQAGDQFGFSVAASGDTAIVGYADIGGGFAGAAYVFVRSQGGVDNWGEVKKLTASDAQAGDEFGHGVAVSGDTAVIGAWFEDAGGTNAGAVYLFEPGSPIPTTKPTDTPLPVSTNTPVTALTPVATATPEVSTGDANCDGAVSVIDAALILQLSAGLIGSLPCAGSADVNVDGMINPLDAALILQFTAGLLSSLPP